MRRQLTRFWRAGAVVAFVFAIPDAAWAVKRHYSLPCAFVHGKLIVQNTTGRDIPAGTVIHATLQTPGGPIITFPGPENTRKSRPNQKDKMGLYWHIPPFAERFYYDFPAGSSQVIWQFADWSVVRETKCTVTVTIEEFQEKVEKKIPKYTRSRPPGPPGPGLLEPGFPTDPHKPSGIGTAKPSAPPPFISR